MSEQIKQLQFPERLTIEQDGALREIYRACDVSNNRVHALSEDEAIAQIHQAYKDADYFHVAKTAEYLTDQEFYERFEKELGTGIPLPDVMDIWVRTCAKRAAGLE